MGPSLRSATRKHLGCIIASSSPRRMAGHGDMQVMRVSALSRRSLAFDAEAKRLEDQAQHLIQEVAAIRRRAEGVGQALIRIASAALD